MAEDLCRRIFYAMLGVLIVTIIGKNVISYAHLEIEDIYLGEHEEVVEPLRENSTKERNNFLIFCDIVDKPIDYESIENDIEDVSIEEDFTLKETSTISSVIHIECIDTIEHVETKYVDEYIEESIYQSSMFTPMSLIIEEVAPPRRYVQLHDIMQATGLNTREFDLLIDDLVTRRRISDRNKVQGTGEVFVFIEEEYDINGILLLAIAWETEWGSAGVGRSRNNLFGLIDSIGARRYDTPAESIIDAAELLVRYRNRGRTTFSSIGNAYCPPNPVRWANVTKEFYDTLVQRLFDLGLVITE
jgi:hypothetical protein